MATYTSYLNLEKPTTSETFNLLKMNQNWDKIDAGVSALNSNLNNMGDTAVTVTEISSRATILEGGTYIFGKLLVIQFTAKAMVSATNSPGVARVHDETLLCDAALTAIDITAGIGNAITSGVPCGISAAGTIYIKEIVTDHIYAVSGMVRCQ